MACEDFPCCGHKYGECPTMYSDGNKTFRRIWKQSIKDEIEASFDETNGLIPDNED